MKIFKTILLLTTCLCLSSCGEHVEDEFERAERICIERGGVPIHGILITTMRECQFPPLYVGGTEYDASSKVTNTVTNTLKLSATKTIMDNLDNLDNLQNYD